ncbi:MAG: substrate-binding domain-containing protein [Pseudomonadota bacterium]
MNRTINNFAIIGLSLVIGQSSFAANKTIGLAFPSADHGWMGAIIKNAEDQAKAQGVKYVLTTASDPNKQTNDIENLIAKKVDAVVILPVENDVMNFVAARLRAAKIPLIVVDRELKTPYFAALVRGDNVGIGVNAGKYLCNALGGKGNVVEIIGVPASVTTQRSTGFRQARKACPGLKLVDYQAGDFSKDKAYATMQKILKLQPKIDAIYTHDDEMALGVLQAVQEAKRSDVKVITGAGGNKEVYKLIMDGNSLIKATFVYSPLMVKDAVKLAEAVASGQAPKQKVMVIPATEVTAGNVAQYFDAQANY